MFCSTCGAELAPSAKFCSGCGTSMGGAQEAKPSVDLKNPVIAIRPVFVPWVSVVSVLPLALFFSIWGGGFLGTFLMIGLGQWVFLCRFGQLCNMRFSYGGGDSLSGLSFQEAHL